VRNEPNSRHQWKKSGGDAQPTKSRLCETKPNLGELGYPGTGALGEPSMRNKANPLRRHGRPLPGHRWDFLSKQSQLAAARREGQVLYGKRVMVNWTGKGWRRNKANSSIADCGLGVENRRAASGPRGPIVPNKPNSEEGTGRGRGDCAKQSQTWAGWDIWRMACQGGANRAKQSQFASGRDTPAFHHSNIPTRWRSCETKPIPSRPPYAGRTARGARRLVLGTPLETRYTRYPAPHREALNAKRKQGLVAPCHP
jgi:hypothetical protein